MEYKAFKYFNDKEKMPTDFSLAYYDPTINTFAYYACSLFVHSDGTYHLEGPDEDLKQEIDMELKENNNKLVMYNGSRTFEEGGTKSTAIYVRAVDFDDPDFHRAFDETVSCEGLGRDYFYTGSKDSNKEFIKVNSVDDVNKLEARREEFRNKWLREFRE